MIPVISIDKQTLEIKHLIQSEIISVLDSNQFILGGQVRKFEGAIAEYLKVSHAIGVANGTDALVLSLDALGIGPGDEVITTPFTFFASAEAICRVGATPVFVDVLEDTYNIDPFQIEAAITSKTKALLVVHIFGNPVACEDLVAIARKHNLYIVEDACQAIGASYEGHMIGSIGDIACFSFFPTKNLGAFGDGGMITTNNEQLAERIRMLRFHGQRVKYQNEILGYNSRLDEIQAAILNVKFQYLESWNARRCALADRYNQAFRNVPGLCIPVETEHAHSVYHLYSLMVDERDRLAHFLSEKGVGSSIYYAIPLHLQKALQFLGYKSGDFPASERLSARALALPMYPELSDQEQDEVIKAVLSFYR